MPKRLVALSSSAIASIYFAGLFSTRAAADGMAADGLATAAFILGLEDGRRFLDEQADVSGVFIPASGGLVCS